MRFGRIVILFFAAMLACLVLTACGPGTYINSSTGKVWQVDPDGNVQTNDFNRLQRATPFKIVVPRYLPDELASVPVMYSKTIGLNSKNDVDIRFSYPSGIKGVDIEEVNYALTWIPNDKMENTYLDIAGTKVLQAKSQNVRQSTLVTTFFYTWYRNRISFAVDVWDYDETESRKIVESMID